MGTQCSFVNSNRLNAGPLLKVRCLFLSPPPPKKKKNTIPPHIEKIPHNPPPPTHTHTPTLTIHTHTYAFIPRMSWVTPTPREAETGKGHTYTTAAVLDGEIAARQQQFTGMLLCLLILCCCWYGTKYCFLYGTDEFYI